MLRTIIVDDEPLGRRRLQQLLEGEADVDVVAACANGADAVDAVARHTPDLLFLDVQMPLMDGFDVLDAIPPAERPVVVFVTAYDRYALRAFEVHALDYLLKPFDRLRFQEALQRARRHLRHHRLGDLHARLSSLLADRTAVPPPAAPKAVHRFAVKDGGRVFFVPAAEVAWIEAAGNYVRLHVGRQAHLLRETMAGLEARLDPRHFVRIHRSTIVNVDHIEAFELTPGGEYDILLRGGPRLPSTRTYRDNVVALIR